MPRKKTITDTQFEGRELCKEPHTFSEDQLRTQRDMVLSMLERHSKVTEVRMDLRFPKGFQYSGSNAEFSGTMQGACREFARKGYDPQYVAKREQITSDHPHYHVAIVVNGNKKRDFQDIRSTVEKNWAKALNVPLEEAHEKELVYPCNKAPDSSPRACGYLIDRNKPDVQDQIDKVLQQMSYMAKIEEDDVTPPRTKKFFASQFGKDYQKAIERKRFWAEKRRNNFDNGTGTGFLN